MRVMKKQCKGEEWFDRRKVLSLSTGKAINMDVMVWSLE
jgi:hypothetical protein